LYAILQSLMSALQITDPMQFSGSFLQAFVGSSQIIVLSVASVLLSSMVALIPYIASRIVRGEIGSTLMTVVSGVVGAEAIASKLSFAAGSGVAMGHSEQSGLVPLLSGSSTALRHGGGTATSSSGGATVTGASRPPTPPRSDVDHGASARAGDMIGRTMRWMGMGAEQ
jgi:uncharacterized membrane protein YeaQ/YmgE (transglycosylase-associated protein family)